MTAQTLATQIVDRRGGREAYASYKQTAWLLDLINKDIENINWVQGNGKDEYYFAAADGNGKICVITRYPHTSAKIVRFDSK